MTSAWLFIFVGLATVTVIFSKPVDKIITNAEENFNKHHPNADHNDGGYRVEGDIIVPIGSVDQKRNSIAYTNYYWPDKRVAYVIPDDVFTEHAVSVIEGGIAEWADRTCLDFVNVGSSDENKIQFVKADGCYSYVGMVGGTQNLSIGANCDYHSVVLHEIGHAIGWFHEHNRPDRDDFVTIHLENVKDGKESAFTKNNANWINYFGVAYDYLSTMHYGERFFSKNSKKTIVLKDPSFNGRVGNADTLSFGDVKQANVMYECADHCTNTPCPDEGFVDKNCVCQCAGDPLTPCSLVTAAPTAAVTAAPTAAVTVAPPARIVTTTVLTTTELTTSTTQEPTTTLTTDEPTTSTTEATTSSTTAEPTTTATTEATTSSATTGTSTSSTTAEPTTSTTTEATTSSTTAEPTTSTTTEVTTSPTTTGSTSTNEATTSTTTEKSSTSSSTTKITSTSTTTTPTTSSTTTELP